MKTGLVLEGGAMRGMYTAGALDVLLENDINFDGIIGTSAGAVFGVNFLSRQDGRVIRYNCRFNGDRNYMGIKPLLKNGDFSTRNMPITKCRTSLIYSMTKPIRNQACLFMQRSPM